jgi:hypothetical protein
VRMVGEAIQSEPATDHGISYHGFCFARRRPILGPEPLWHESEELDPDQPRLPFWTRLCSSASLCPTFRSRSASWLVLGAALRFCRSSAPLALFPDLSRDIKWSLRLSFVLKGQGGRAWWHGNPRLTSGSTQADFLGGLPTSWAGGTLWAKPPPGARE